MTKKTRENTTPMVLKTVYLKGVDSRELEAFVVRSDERPEEGPERGHAVFFVLGFGGLDAAVDVVEDHAHQGDDKVGLGQQVAANVPLNPLEQRVGASAVKRRKEKHTVSKCMLCFR